MLPALGDAQCPLKLKLRLNVLPVLAVDRAVELHPIAEPLCFPPDLVVGQLVGLVGGRRDVLVYAIRAPG